MEKQNFKEKLKNVRLDRKLHFELKKTASNNDMFIWELIEVMLNHFNGLKNNQTK